MSDKGGDGKEDLSLDALASILSEGKTEGSGAEGGASRRDGSAGGDKLVVAGREFAPHELAKAYEALLKDYTKKSQELGKFKKDQNAAPAAGEAELSRAPSGIDLSPLKAVADKLDEIERWRVDQELAREEEALKAKHGDLSNRDLAQVYAISANYGGIPLEEAYEIYQFKKEKARRAQPPGGVPGGSAGRVAPHGGAASDYRAKVRDILRDAGYR